MELYSKYSFMSGFFLPQNYVCRLIRVVSWSAVCVCGRVGFVGLGFVVPGFLHCTQFPCMKTPHITVSVLTSVCTRARAPLRCFSRDGTPGSREATPPGLPGHTPLFSHPTPTGTAHTSRSFALLPAPDIDRVRIFIFLCLVGPWDTSL